MKRFEEIDFLRGLAVMGMVVFHFLFILYFFGFLRIALYEGYWFIFARTVQLIFLFLVGVSLYLSYVARANDFLLRQWRRFFLLAGCAGLVSLMSWIFIPDFFVRFGVLHLISVAILAGMWFAKTPRLALFFAFLFFAGSFYTDDILLAHIGGIGDFLFYILGARVADLYTVDSFPLLPWLSAPFAGIFFGAVFYAGGERGFLMSLFFEKNALGQDFFSRVIIFCGRRALAIYMLHVPIICVILFLLGYF